MRNLDLLARHHSSALPSRHIETHASLCPSFLVRVMLKYSYNCSSHPSRRSLSPLTFPGGGALPATSFVCCGCGAGVSAWRSWCGLAGGGGGIVLADGWNGYNRRSGGAGARCSNIVVLCSSLSILWDNLV